MDPCVFSLQIPSYPAKNNDNTDNEQKYALNEIISILGVHRCFLLEDAFK